MARGKLSMQPIRQVKKVIVVSHDLRQHARNATMPLITECQMASYPNRVFTLSST